MPKGKKRPPAWDKPMVLNSRLKVIQRYMFLFCYGFSFSKHMYNMHWLVQILMFWNRIYGKPQFYNNSIHDFSETSYLCSLFFSLQWQPFYNIHSLRYCDRYNIQLHCLPFSSGDSHCVYQPFREVISVALSLLVA